MERVWNRYLSERDREHLSRTRRSHPVGIGRRPALLLVDNYLAALGERAEPLLDAIGDWPRSTGEEGWAAVSRIQRLLEAVRVAGLPVVHVTGSGDEETGIADWFELRNSCDTGSARTRKDRTCDSRYERRFEITPSLKPEPGEALVKKSAPSAFWGTPLIGHLRALDVDTLFVVGESTSGCVRATVVDAASYRFRVIVPEECVYDRHEACHAINLFDMHQKYADVVPLEDVLKWIEEQRS